MRIAKIIGTVTLSRPHASLAQARLKLAVPMNLDELRHDRQPQAESMVLFDELGAGLGSLVAVSEGREAAQPFHPEVKPIDAYNAALLDRVDINA